MLKKILGKWEYLFYMKKTIRLTETQLTSIVKRLVNESTTSELLKDMIKMDGWKHTSDIVGDSESLKKLTNIQTVGDLLDFYGVLETVKENDKGEVRVLDPNGYIVIKAFTDGDGHRLLAIDSILASSLREFCNNKNITHNNEIINFFKKKLKTQIDYVRSWPIEIN